MRHKTIMYLETRDIRNAALEAFKDFAELATQQFLYRLFYNLWDWRKESREEFLARVLKIADDACTDQERLVRGYGGNCTYHFEKKYGEKKLEPEEGPIAPYRVHGPGQKTYTS